MTLDNSGERVEPGQYLGLALRALPVLLLIGAGCSIAGGALVASLGLVASAVTFSLLIGAGAAGFVLVIVFNALVADWQTLSLKQEEAQKDAALRRKLAGKLELGGNSAAIVSFNSHVESPSISVDGRRIEVNGLPAGLLARVLDLAEQRGTLSRRALVGSEVGQWGILTQADYNRVIDALRDRNMLLRGRNNTVSLVGSARDAKLALGLPLSGQVIEGDRG